MKKKMPKILSGVVGISKKFTYPVGKAIWVIPNRLAFQICIELKTLRPVACA